MSDSLCHPNVDSPQNTLPPILSFLRPPDPSASHKDSLTRNNYFESSDLGSYSTLTEASNEPSSPSNPPISPASSFGSMGIGVSHPPVAKRRTKKLVTMKFSEFADGGSAKRGEFGGSTVGQFVCHILGCSAPPFQTVDLLNSHVISHLVARPYFCPVQDCVRGEVERGFRCKNERIRHQLVHHGYLCPFCPDQEHRYPRPENLQRHVRVNHADIDQNDPQLREALEPRKRQRMRNRYTEDILPLQDDIERTRKENRTLKAEIEKTSKQSLALTMQITELQDTLKRSVGSHKQGTWG